MRSKSAASRKGWETWRQNNDRVESNLPADHLPLWRRIRTSFFRYADAHEMFEKFSLYCEEHPGEVVEAMQASADRALTAMLRDRAPSAMEIPEFDAPAEPEHAFADLLQ